MPYSNIDKPSKYFNTVLYAGNNGSSQSITGVGFSPDFVWIKNRTDARNNVLTDIVRGATKTLFSQSTSAEATNPTDGYLSSFDSDGFSVSQGSINNENVCATDNYVSWNWDANGTGVSNTSGTISSTVSANTTSGFSIVSYTYTSGNVTVGHGLGVAPAMIIVKARSVSDNWRIYHKSLGNSAFIPFTTAAQTTGSTVWNSTSPTSSVFSLGSFWGGTDTTIAYCFAEVKGFSKAFSYTGNGSTDGTFVYCGFRPAFVLIKNTSIAQDWFINDNKRLGYNGGNYVLYPDLSSAEASSPQVDILSNGFKTRTVDAMINNSGYNYVGFAFAENPFVSSKGIPTCAR